MTPTKQQLLDALVKEYEYLCHDDYDPEEDVTPEEYRESLEQMSYEDLITETGTDEEYTLEEYLEVYGDTM